MAHGYTIDQGEVRRVSGYNEDAVPSTITSAIPQTDEPFSLPPLVESYDCNVQYIVLNPALLIKEQVGYATCWLLSIRVD
jgi:hypothetical protein